ncbi:MAG TPA: hypothetical protein VLV83_15415 [Acidobacteriota bacterium]|nr:hypothetical protein [Acidobacteriota bacterium]
MKRCQAIQERIEAYAAGVDDSWAAVESLEDRRHLRECPQCAQAWRQAQELRQGLQAWSEEAERASRGVEDELVRRLEGQGAFAPAPGQRRPWIHLAAIAAALLAALLLWKGLAPGSSPLPGSSTSMAPQASAASQELLRQVEVESSREEILRYLERSQLVLAALMDTSRDCNEGNQVEIGYERRLAESLLFDKQLLETDLARPGNAGVRRLCDELEMVLLDVASADNCVDAQQIERWKDLLDSRSTLMRLRMASREATI